MTAKSVQSYLELRHLADRQHDIATAFYNSRFDADLYRAATENTPPGFCNRLLDDALAISGDPFYKLSYTHNYSDAAKRFLAAFAKS
jgi:hypothetical protein